MTKIIIKDGVRYPEDFAKRHGITLKDADQVQETTDGVTSRTTTAVGVAVVVDDVSGKVITSAAQDGADDRQTPVGENLGLANPEDKKTATATQKRAAKAAAPAPVVETAEGTTTGDTATGDTAGDSK